MRDSRGAISLLVALQALLLTSNVVTTLFGGPVGALLAPDVAFATAPITTFVVGTALTAFPASLMMMRYGRRAGFALGAAVGLLGAVVSAAALFSGHARVSRNPLRIRTM